MHLGRLNEHAVGIVLKELVRRAIVAIRNERHAFEVTEKNAPGEKRDILTSADLAAQRVYLKGIQECFPDCGVVSEEEGFYLDPKTPDGPCFSVDPLDGTKALERRQSYGVGTQIALAHQGEIITAWVGDVMTQEIYGFRPDSEKVHRISEYEISEKLQIDSERPLAEQYLLMRSSPAQFSPWMRNLAMKVSVPALFRDLDVEGGSIALSFARLWKGEVGGILMSPHKNTPWDLWPVVGISKKLGFVFLQGPDTTPPFLEYKPQITRQTELAKQATLVVHRSRLRELAFWQAQSGL